MKKTTLALFLTSTFLATTALATIAVADEISITINKIAENAGIELGTHARARGEGAIATGRNAIAMGKNAVATGGNEDKDTITAKLNENKQKLAEIDTQAARVDQLLSEIQDLRTTQARVIEAGERVKQVRQAKENARLDWQDKLSRYNTEVANSQTFFDEVNAKLEDLNSRLTGMNRIENVDITSDEGLTRAATQLKEMVEKDTTLNLANEFYKDYVKSHYQALGDLRENNMIYSKSSSSDFSKGANNNQLNIVNGYFNLYYIYNNNTNSSDYTFFTKMPGTYKGYNDEIDLGGYYFNNNSFSGDESISSPDYHLTFKNILTDLSTEEEYKQAQITAPQFKAGFKAYFDKTNDRFFTKEVKEATLNALNKKIDLAVKSIEITYYQNQYETTKDTTWLDKKKKAIDEFKQLTVEFKALPDSRNMKYAVIQKWKKENIDDIMERNKITTDKLTADLEQALNINKEAIKQKEKEIARLKSSADQAQTNYNSINPDPADLLYAAQYEQVMRELADKANALQTAQERLTVLRNALTLHDLTNVGENAIAFGTNALATGQNAIAFGTDTIAVGENAIAIGKGSSVTGTNSIAIGTGHIVIGHNAGTFGDPNTIYADNAYAIGNNNTIGSAQTLHSIGSNTFVFGNNVTTTANNAVILGANSTDGGDDTVSVGSASKQRKIVYVANGEINNTSKDAINGSQLHDILENATGVNISKWQAKLGTNTATSDSATTAALTNLAEDIATHLGGNAANNNGRITAPSYNVTDISNNKTTDTAYHNIGEAINALNDNDKTLKQSIDKKANIDASNIDAAKFTEKLGTGTVSENDSHLVTGKAVYTAIQNAVINGADVSNKANKDATNLDATDITNWQEKLGTNSIEANSKKLVNSGAVYRYIKDSNQNVLAAANSYTDSRINGLKRYTDKQIRQLKEETRAGIASAMAMSAIPTISHKRYSIGAGTATFRGENAVAIGLKVKSERHNAVTSFSISAGSNGDIAGAAGFAFGF